MNTVTPKEPDNTISELQKALVNDLSWLLKESNDYNMIVNVGDSPNIKSFKVHTSVLRARSLYFRAILSSNQHFSPDGRNSLIQITQANIKPDVFDVILKYLYTGKFLLEDEKDAKKLFEYIIAAERLWLIPLIQYIENYLLTQMNDWLKSNIVYVLMTIQSNPSSFKLLEEFSSGILKNHPDLLFESDDFYNLPESTLINLLQRRNFSKDIPEKKLLSVVLNWGIKQNPDLVAKKVREWSTSDFNKLQTSLQHCIPLIRFTMIPPESFFEIMGPYKRIFTPTHYERIMQLPTFLTYNKSSRSSTKLKLQPIFPSTPLFASILRGFPRPPSRKSTIMNKQTSSVNCSRSNSPLTYSRPISPVNDSRPTSPVKYSRSVSPVNGSQPTSPVIHSRSGSSVNDSQPSSPVICSRSGSSVNGSQPASPRSRSASTVNGSQPASRSRSGTSVNGSQPALPRSRSASTVNGSQPSSRSQSGTSVNGFQSASPVNYSQSVSPVNGSLVVPSVNCPRSDSLVNDSSRPVSPTQQQSATSSAITKKSKHLVRRKARSLAFDKQKVLLVDRHRTLPAPLRNKQRPISVYSIESSNDISSPMKAKLKRTSIFSSKKKQKSGSTAVLGSATEDAALKTKESFGPTVDISPLVVRKGGLSRKKSNRKTSIISISPITN